MCTTLALHVYFLWALSGEKMRRNMYSVICNLEGEMCQENKGEKNHVCKTKESKKRRNLAIVGMSVELLNATD